MKKSLTRFITSDFVDLKGRIIMERTSKVVFEKYAIIQTGGKQYQAIPGKTIAIEKLAGEAGDAVTFSQVLFTKTAESTYTFGKPFIEGAKVTANIVKQMRGPKIIVFKFKRRKKYRVKRGHRQAITVVRIENI